MQFNLLIDSFLSESNIFYKGEQTNSLTCIGYKRKPGKSNYFTIYSTDRIKLKTDILSLCIEHNISYKETLKPTIIKIENSTIDFKPISGKSDAISTSLNELSTSLIISLFLNINTFNSINEITNENYKDALQFTDITNETEIIDFITKNENWHKTYFESALLIKNFINLKLNVYRNNDFINKIISKFNEVKKLNPVTKTAHKDKWNPADIWLVNHLKEDEISLLVDSSKTLEDLNSIIKQFYNSKDLIPISLKKLNVNPKIEEVYFDSSKIKLTNIKIPPNSKDVYIQYSDNEKDILHIRSKGFQIAIELSGVSAIHGCIGLSKTIEIIKKYETNFNILSLKESTILYNENIDIFLNKIKELELFFNCNINLDKLKDGIIVKLICMQIVYTIYNNELKDLIINDIVRYCKSCNEWSSVFLKIS